MDSRGLSDVGPGELGPQVVAAWDAFLALARSADLTRASRLPGWTGHDVCAHLGSWPDHDVVASVLALARDGATSARPDQDASNARVVAAHRDASSTEVLAALQRGRDSVATFFASPEAEGLGKAPAHSAVGALPVQSLLHAACFELAVHALDLAPCGAAPPAPVLLDRGLAALMDVTGALSAQAGIEITLTAMTPAGGWSFSSDTDGWRIAEVPTGPLRGTGVRGSAVDLLDTSAGRTNLGQLLLTRRLVVSQLPSFMRLAPLLSEVPGLPGGAALRSAVAGLGGVTRVLGRFRRG